jgi:hypothetical protein
MQKVPQKLLLVELNEVNFDFVRRYIARGELPTLAGLLSRHGLVETSSETEYEHLEPWIQWVTAHTGKTFAEHGVFRLGDIVDRDIDQIWERLERGGLRVGAISPMNAKNRTRDAAFFVPDPWTRTAVSGDRSLQLISEALSQAVGDNASARIAPGSYLKLLRGLAAHFRVSTIGQLLKFVLGRPSSPWYGAMFLDRFLADVFVRQWRRHQPDFSSLFLNAAAHIQHHYMFSSSVYDGPNKNPAWYLAPGKDPLLDIYRAYDDIVSDMLALPGAPRLMLATGLHQDPYPTELYYYRLVDHASFLKRLGISFESVLPLMSRDFTSHSQRAGQPRCRANAAGCGAPDGIPVFSVDNRGSSLFAMLTYPKKSGPASSILNGRALWDIARCNLRRPQNGNTTGRLFHRYRGAGESERGSAFELPGRIAAALSRTSNRSSVCF